MPPAPPRLDDPVLPAVAARRAEGWHPRRDYLAAGFTLLPNVGGVLEAGRVWRRTEAFSAALEVQVGLQPLDDKAFIDNGDPPAGDWFQAAVGLALRSRPRAQRHATVRAGAFWFRAEGAPNWVDVAGDWWGGYVAAGFESDLSPRWSVGPALTLMVGTPTAEPHLELIPQLVWRATYWLGSSATCCAPLPPGELYLGLNASASPGWGGGFSLGQVFARHPEVVWSFEVSTVFQPLTDGTLFGEGGGEFAELLGGVKAVLRPGGRVHPVLRVGATWLRATAETTWLDRPGDALGAYLGLGLEFDVGQHLTTGPEVAGALVTQEGRAVELEVVPRLSWHVIWKL